MFYLFFFYVVFLLPGHRMYIRWRRPGRLLNFLHCVKSVRIRGFSGPYFPAFGLNTERYSVSLRIQFECGKIRTRTSPNKDNFHVVLCRSIYVKGVNRQFYFTWSLSFLWFLVLRSSNLKCLVSWKVLYCSKVLLSRVLGKIAIFFIKPFIWILKNYLNTEYGYVNLTKIISFLIFSGGIKVN